MGRIRRAVAVLAVAGGTLACTEGTAGADRGRASCVAQEIGSIPQGQRGPALRSAAHELWPFGQHAAATATSPKNHCPFENAGHS